MEILYLTTEYFGTIHVIVPVWMVVIYCVLIVAGILVKVSAR